MKMLKNARKNWLILGLCVPLAALTNHSHGEVVYRKLIPLRDGLGQAETTPITAENSLGSESSGAMKVLRIQPRGTTFEVLLAGGLHEGILPGTRLEAQRLHESFIPNQKPQWIPTAILKTIAVRDSYTLAEVVEDGSVDSGLHFPDAPGLMVGDTTLASEPKIVQNIRILPSRVLTYEKLFIDPKILPTSFELSSPGRALLIEQARVLIAAHSSLLLVEGHTDPQGDSPSNQVESYQRAMTVRQVLIDEFALDPSRIVAIGLGETEALDEPYLPGRAEEARRIVLKIKSQANP